jgi:cob(I)alamin adenosyltransferase
MKPLVSGERAAADRLHPNLQVFGESRPYDVCADQTESNTCREDSRANFETARTLMLSGEYDVVIMDEIHLVLHYGYVTRDEMKELLSERSSMIELVLTGRYAPEWLLEEADLVTEMMEVKHPAARGVKARKGMEY